MRMELIHSTIFSHLTAKYAKIQNKRLSVNIHLTLDVAEVEPEDLAPLCYTVLLFAPTAFFYHST